MSSTDAAPSATTPSLGERRRALAVGATFAVGLTVKQVLAFPPREAGMDVGPALLTSSAGTALLALAVGLCFSGRARLLALLALDLVLTALHQVDLLYFRNFAELPSIATLGLARQAVDVAGAAAALLRPRDLLLWPDVLVLAALALGPARVAPRGRPGAARDVALVGLLLFAPGAVQLFVQPRREAFRGAAQALVAAELNVAGFHAYDAASRVARRVRRVALGERRRREVADVASAAAPRAPGPLSGRARGRNVIVLQLESFQAFARGLTVRGEPVTPALDRLAGESLVFERFYAQVGQGTTSDAELAAGCSLHALAAGSAFVSYADQDYRCLPELLGEQGYRTVVMHANRPDFWNRARMYPAMGYESFLAAEDFDREPAAGMGLADARFLEQAADRLAATPEPFLATLVTLSMHAPFTGIPRVLEPDPSHSPQLGAYLNAARYVDGAIGAFVERLRAAGLLDRSVLVIYGDHHGLARSDDDARALALPRERADVWLEFERRVPFLVRLPGGAGAGARTAVGGQVDVAPTLADLLGLSTADAPFLGRSLVSSPDGAVVLPDGSALDGARVYLSPEQRWGGTGCFEAGLPVAAERCAELALRAARTLEVSRALIEDDLTGRLAAAAPGSLSSPPQVRATVGIDAKPW